MTLGSHQRSVGKCQAHITPKWIIDRLGPFDLDPCAAWPRPWHCADHSFTRDGISRPWEGRVFLNPPFDRYEVGKWIAKLADHGNGTALLHARTETAWFEPVWKSASAILFMADRIKFCTPAGVEQKANSGAPAVLIAFGLHDRLRIERAGIPGAFCTTWRLLDQSISDAPLLAYGEAAE